MKGGASPPAAVPEPETAAVSETPEQMNQRLCGVIAHARFTVLAEPHAWQPLARSTPLPASALAVVRDGEACTGAMVVCGFDARATAALWQTSLGLFDYWGCPWGQGRRGDRAGRTAP